MLAFLRRLLIGERPPAPRVSELVARVADVELELAALDSRLEDAVKAINARITNKLRQKAAEDAPSETNDEPPTPQRQVAGSRLRDRMFRRY